MSDDMDEMAFERDQPSGYVERSDFNRFIDGIRQAFRDRDESHFEILLDRFRGEVGL